MAKDHRRLDAHMAQEEFLLDDPTFLREIGEKVVQEVLEAKMTHHIGAAPYERTDKRTSHRNGYKRRTLRTRVGTLNLLLPQDADGAIPSPVHLSLQTSHRRGWGSLYAALCKGRIDAEVLRKLLARHPLAQEETPIYAVDVSVWDRCDAECSPERGF